MKKLHFYLLFALLMPCFSAFGQTEVAIAEVLYDSPLSETASIIHEGEFMSLYNYGEDSADLSGWRIEITSLMSATQVQYNYTIPSGTILTLGHLLIIASRANNSTFDVVDFYGFADTIDGHIVLYNSELTFPNTRSQIRIYDADNNLHDEMTYDGITPPLDGEQRLRATNTANAPYFSVQRKTITSNNYEHVFHSTDYYPHLPEQPVRMFSLIPPQYAFEGSSIRFAPPLTLPDLTLTGTVTSDKNHVAPNITSTQTIASGKTTYTADEGIVLNAGFEVKSGAEFEAKIGNVPFNALTIMTYNLGSGLQGRARYKKHAEVIYNANADIVSLQEVRLWFGLLKRETNMSGRLIPAYVGYVGDHVATAPIFLPGGNALLWNKSTVGDPKQIETTYVFNNNIDIQRCYSIAEFTEFYLIFSHFSTEQNERIDMVESILKEDIIKNRADSKPIYIAGDLNARRENSENPPRPDEEIDMLLNSGFEVLNRPDWSVERDSDYIDLILEHNLNPKHKLLKTETFDGYHWDWFVGDDKISDHKPYRVKVKIK